MKIIYLKLLLVSIILCCFTSSFAQITISDFNPKFGAPGATIVIAGSGFNTIASNNVVYFGDHLATINSANATSLTVTVPKGTSYSRITIINTVTKLLATSIQFFCPTFLSNGVFDINSFADKKQVFLSANNVATGLEIIDLNNDGFADVIISNSVTDTLSTIQNGTTNISNDIILDTAKAIFTNVANSGASAIAKGDLDGDGKLDLVVANSTNATISIYKNTSSSNINQTTFASPFTISGTNAVADIFIEDMNSDGKPEIIFNDNSYPIYIIQNSFSGSNLSASSFGNKVLVDINVEKFLVADLNADGKPDIALIYGSSIAVLKNNIATNGIFNLSSFGAPSFYYPSSSYNGMDFGDIDSDGKIDVVVSDKTNNQVFVLQNSTTITSTISFNIIPVTGSEIYSPEFTSISDIDGDSKPDIIVSGIYGYTTIIKNSIIGNSITGGSFSNKYQSYYYNTHLGQKIADFDNDGKPDLGFITIGNSVPQNIYNSYFFEVNRNTFDTNPTIQNVMPAIVHRGDIVSISGIFFNSITGVNIGENPAEFTVINSNLIISTVPGNVWNADIEVTSVKPSTYYYNLSFAISPAITSFLPLSGKPGDLVTIIGNDLLGAVNVRFGSTFGNVISYTNKNAIVKVPQNAGYGEIELTLYSNASYNYLSAKSISAFIPNYPGTSALSGTSFSNITNINTTYPNISDFELAAYRDLQKPDLIPFYFSYNNYSIFDWYVNNTLVNIIDTTSFTENSISNISPTSSNAPLIKYGQIYGDWYTDAVLYFSSTNDIQIYQGTSNGLSQYSNLTFNTNFYVYNIVLGDFTKDGIDDIAAQGTLGGIPSVVIFQNDIGSFSPIATITGISGYWSNGMEISDINQDGTSELIGLGFSNVEILTSTCTGTVLGNCFINNTFPVSGNGELKIADLNNDQLPEIMISYPFSPTGSAFLDIYKNVSTINTISITATGGFNLSVSNSGISQPDMAVGDLDGDSKLDIAFFNIRSTASYITLLQNNSSNGGNINLINSSTLTFSGFNSKKIKINDLDGDWRPEIILASNNSITTEGITILKNSAPASQIYVPVDSIIITPNNGFAIITTPGGSIQLNIQTLPLLATDKSWSSYIIPSYNYAYIDSTGKFSAKTNGIYQVGVNSNAYGSNASQIIYITVTGQNLFVTDFSPYSAVPGNILSITGNYFNTNPDSNYVLIGGVRAPVIASDLFSMQVVIPEGGRFGLLSVTNSHIDATALSPNSFLPTFNGSNPIIDTSLIKVSTILNSSSPYTMASSDLDGDGFTDLIVSNLYDTTVTIFRNISYTNQGTINFAAAVNITTGHNPNSILVQDMDRNGKPDIIVAESNDQTLSIFYNNANPGNLTNTDFSAPNSSSTGNSIAGINTLDVDDDGFIDILVIDSTYGYLTIYSTNPAICGECSPITLFNLSSSYIGNGLSSIDVGDLDKDGIQEIVISLNKDSSLFFAPKNVTNSKCSNCKAGGIGSYIKLNFNSDLVKIVDLDGDSYPDILSLNYTNQNVSILRNITGLADSISFRQAAVITFSGFPSHLDVGDINGDNLPDLAITDTLGFVYLFQNRSTPGNLDSNSFIRNNIVVGAFPSVPLISDFDNDSRPDLAITHQSFGNISIYRNSSPFVQGTNVTQIIVISEDSASVLSLNRKQLQMKAIILPFGADTSVTWSLIHNSSANTNDLTTISSTGLLALNSTTINGIVTVAGTSVSNPNVSGYFAVTIIGKSVTPAILIASNENLTIAGFVASPCYATYELSVPSVTGQSYQWYYNDLDSSYGKKGLKLVDANNNIYKPVVNGYYYVIALDTIAYVYHNYPVTTSGFNSASIAGINNNTKLIIVKDSIADSYQWYVDNIPIKNATSNSLNVYYNGTYYLITKNNADGCKLKSNEIQIGNENLRSIQESGLIKDSTVENYGPDIQPFDVKVYPNPASSVFTIEVKSQEDINTYEITDITGRIMEAGEMLKSGSKSSITANNRHLDKGIYFVTIRNQSQKKCIKVVLE